MGPNPPLSPCCFSTLPTTTTTTLVLTIATRLCSCPPNAEGESSAIVRISNYFPDRTALSHHDNSNRFVLCEVNRPDPIERARGNFLYYFPAVTRGYEAAAQVCRAWRGDAYLARIEDSETEEFVRSVSFELTSDLRLANLWFGLRRAGGNNLFHDMTGRQLSPYDFVGWNNPQEVQQDCEFDSLTSMHMHAPCNPVLGPSFSSLPHTHTHTHTHTLTQAQTHTHTLSLCLFLPHFSSPPQTIQKQPTAAHNCRFRPAPTRDGSFRHVAATTCLCAVPPQPPALQA